MNESVRSWTWGRRSDDDDVAPTAVVLLAEPCLRPLSRSNDGEGEDISGEMGDWIGVVSGEDEAESEVLSLVVKVRKMGIVKDGGDLKS
jgi:hypothetical protein